MNTRRVTNQERCFDFESRILVVTIVAAFSGFPLTFFPSRYYIGMYLSTVH
jgi:hypothetical protein